MLLLTEADANLASLFASMPPWECGHCGGLTDENQDLPHCAPCYKCVCYYNERDQREIEEEGLTEYDFCRND